MSEPTVTFHVESRELEPTPPDAQGRRWSRVEETGRAWWTCSCGGSCALKPRAEALDEFRAHAETHGLVA